MTNISPLTRASDSVEMTESSDDSVEIADSHSKDYDSDSSDFDDLIRGAEEMNESAAQDKGPLSNKKFQLGMFLCNDKVLQLDHLISLLRDDYFKMPSRSRELIRLIHMMWPDMQRPNGLLYPIETIRILESLYDFVLLVVETMLKNKHLLLASDSEHKWHIIDAVLDCLECLVDVFHDLNNHKTNNSKKYIILNDSATCANITDAFLAFLDITAMPEFTELFTFLEPIIHAITQFRIDHYAIFDDENYQLLEDADHREATDIPQLTIINLLTSIT